MKRGFEEIREEILKHLSKNPMNRMELARAVDSDYRTIHRHLIWLIGVEKVKKQTKKDVVYYSRI